MANTFKNNFLKAAGTTAQNAYAAGVGVSATVIGSIGAVGGWWLSSKFVTDTPATALAKAERKSAAVWNLLLRSLARALVTTESIARETLGLIIEGGIALSLTC